MACTTRATYCKMTTEMQAEVSCSVCLAQQRGAASSTRTGSLSSRGDVRVQRPGKVPTILRDLAAQTRTGFILGQNPEQVCHDTMHCFCFDVRTEQHT